MGRRTSVDFGGLLRTQQARRTELFLPVSQWGKAKDVASGGDIFSVDIATCGAIGRRAAPASILLRMQLDDLPVPVFSAPNKSICDREIELGTQRNLVGISIKYRRISTAITL